MLEPGDKVWVVSGPSEIADEQFFRNALVGGLVKRGITVLSKEGGAAKRLDYRWLRCNDRDCLGDLQVLDINGKPDPKAKIRNRITCQVVDLASGKVLISDSFVTETQPFGKLQVAIDAVKEPLPKPLVERESDGLGLSISWLAGSGLTYRHWFNNGTGLQVAATPFFQPSGGTISGFANVGLQGMHTVLHAETFRAFWILGYGLLVMTNGTDSPSMDHGVAPGIGLDYYPTKNLALHAALAYTVSYKIRPAGKDFDAGLGFSPGGALGAFFYF